MLAAAPIIAQPPPLHPVLQIALGGCCRVLGKGFSYTKVGELADKKWQEGQYSIVNKNLVVSTGNLKCRYALLTDMHAMFQLIGHLQ
jgi:hypothetical protein